MTAITAIYTDEQREAMGAAMATNGLKAREVVERAAAGTLELDGRKLDPFTISSPSTVRDQARRYRQRRAGHARSELEALPARDAIEDLRVRLIRVADAELKALERQKAGSRDPERMRQIIRCVREAAAIPGRDDPRPVAPGQRDETGRHNGGATRGGMAAQIIAAASRTHDEPAPATEPPPDPEPQHEPAPEPDPRQEIVDRIQQRLGPVVESEPATAPETAVPAPEYRTLPTAMSAPLQLQEAAEKYGHDPLHQERAPVSRRSSRVPLEDTRSIDEFHRGPR